MQASRETQPVSSTVREPPLRRPGSGRADRGRDPGFQLLLLYQRAGEGAEDLLARARAGGSLAAATVGYGVGNWLLYNGQADAARVVFERIVEADGWSAFGYLAAEAELSRWPSGSAE